MGLRVKRSVRISKGVKLNFSKSGPSVTFGTRGLHYTISASGRKTTSVGIPGTGISYVTSSGGSKRSRKRATSTNRTKQQATIQQEKANEKAAEYENNLQVVDAYNALIDEIRSIHEVCSYPVNWEELRSQPEPFPYLGVGPLEEAAKQKLSECKPFLFGKLLPSIDQKKQTELEEAVQLAKQQDQEDYNNWENLRALAGQVLSGDIESYFYVIEEMHPFEDILDFGSDFDVGTDSPDLMEVEFHAKTAKVVPNHVVSLTQTGKLSSKKMTKTMHFDIVQDYICSCTLRIAREMFALLPIQKVVIHVVDVIQDLPNAEYDDTVLSVMIRRDQFAGIDFDSIDASDTIKSFECNMNFKKTQGLKPVKRIEF